MATNEKAINLETLGVFKEEADNAYQAKLTAGTNITISEDNVISASGGGGGPGGADGKIPTDLVVNTTHTLETASFTGDWSALAEATYTNPGYTPINVTTYQTGSQYQQRWQTASIVYQKNAVYVSGYMCKVTTSVANSVKVTITWVKDEAYASNVVNEYDEVVADTGVKLYYNTEDSKVHIGLDETVLWEGDSAVDTCTLSEPLSNFERVKIYVSTGSMVGTCNEFDLSLSNAQINVRWNAGTGNLYERLAYISVSNDNVLTVSKTLERKYTYATSPAITYTVDGHKSCIVKVVGINRKAV